MFHSELQNTFEEHDRVFWDQLFQNNQVRDQQTQVPINWDIEELSAEDQVRKYESDRCQQVGSTTHDENEPDEFFTGPRSLDELSSKEHEEQRHEVS